MAVVGEASVRIRPTTAGFGAEAESGILGGLRGVVAKGAAILGGLFVAKEAIQGVSNLVDAGEALSKQQRLVSTALKSTGDVAHVTAGGLKAYAEAQAAITGIDAKTITQQEQVLLRFTNIRNEVGKGNDIFNQAATAAQNVAAALGKGLQPTSIAVGKALQDPVHGLTALSRLQVTFTQQQKDQIKALVASGDTLGAQKVILDKLATSYAGAAAAGATFTEKLKATIANAKDAVGQALEPAVAAVTTGLLPVIPQIGRVLSSAVSAIIPAITPALKSVGPVLESVITGVAPVLASLGSTIGQALGAFAPAVTSIGQLLGAIAPIFKPIATAVGLMAQAFSALATPAIQGFVSIAEKIATAIIPPLNSALRTLAPVIKEVAHIFGDTFGAVLDSLAPVIGKIVGLLAKDFAAAVRAIAPLLPPIAKALAEIGGIILDLGASLLTAAIPAFQALVQAVTPLIGPIGQVATLIATTLASAVQQLVPFLQQLISALGTGLLTVVQSLAPIMPSLVNAFLDLVRAVVPLVPPLVQVAQTLASNLAKSIQTVAPFLGQLVDALGKGLTQVIEALVPVVPALAQAFIKIATAVSQVLVAVTPLLPALVQLATLFIQKVGAPALVAIAKAFAGLADALLPVLSNSRVAVPIIDALIAAFVVGKVIAFADSLFSVGQAALELAAQLNVGALASWASQLISTGRAANVAEEGFVGMRAAAAAEGETTIFSTIALGAHAIASGVAAVATAALAAATFVLDAAMDANPITLVVIAIIAIGIAAFEAYQHLTSFANAADAVGRALASAAGVVGRFLAAVTGAIGHGVVDALDAFGHGVASLGITIVDGLASAAADVVSAAPGLFVGLLQFFAELPFDMALSFAAQSGFLIAALVNVVHDIGAALPGLFVTVLAFFGTLPHRIAAVVTASAGAVANVGAELIGAIGASASSAVPAVISAIVDEFKALPGQVGSVLSSLPGIVAGAFSTVGSSIGGALGSAGSAVGGALGGIGGAIGNALSSAGAAAINGIVTGAKGALGGLTAFFTALPGFLRAAASDAGTWLIGVGKDVIGGIITGMVDAVTDVGGFISQIVSTFINAFKSELGAFSPARKLIPLGVSIIEGLVQGMLNTVGLFLSLAGSLPADFLRGLGAVGSVLVGAGQALMTGLVNGATGAVGNVLALFGGLPGRLAGLVLNGASQFIGVGQRFISAILNGLTTSFGTLLSFFQSLPSSLLASVGNIGSQFVSIGTDVVTGIAQGIRNAPGVVESALGDLVHNAISFGKHILGISSPSEVAAAELGIPISEGLALGITRGGSFASRAIQDVIASLGTQAKTALSTAFDPSASIADTTRFQSEIAAALLANPTLMKAYAQVAKNATDAFKTQIKNTKGDINDALAAVGPLRLPADPGNGTALLAFFVGLKNATGGTPAQLSSIVNLTAKLQELNLSSAAASSESMGTALALIAAKADTLGLAADQFNNFRDAALAVGGTSGPVLKQVDENIQAIEASAGRLSPVQIIGLTSAIGDLSNTLPGTDAFTTAIGKINDEAVSLGLGGSFLKAFQQDALGLGGAPVTSINAIRDAVAQLSLTTAGNILTFKQNLDSAFQAAGNAHNAVGPAFGDLTTFTLGLHGASVQAFQSIQQVATSSLAAAQASIAQTGATKGAKEIMDQSIPSLVALGRNLGLSTKGAIDMTGAILGIPPEKLAKIDTNADAQKLLVGLLIDKIGGVKGKDVDVNVHTDQANTALNNLQTKVQKVASIAVGVFASINPIVPFDQAGATIVSVLNRGLGTQTMPDLVLTMHNVDIAGGSVHPLPDAGRVVSSVIRDGFTPLTTSVKVSATVDTASVRTAAVQLSGSLDGLVSASVGALPTVSTAVSNFQQAYASAFDVATKANAAFSAAERKLIADQKAAVDEATIFLDTDAVNKAAAAQKNAISSLRAAANPENFVKDLQTRNTQITQLQADLTKILKFGDTALAASIAAQGTAGLKLAQALSSDKSAAGQAEKLLASGQSLQDKFSKFLTDTFGADFAGAAGQAGASAGQSLASQMADGLLGVLPAARAIVGQLKDVLSEDVSSGLTKQVQGVQQTVANATINPGTGLGAQGAQATPIVLAPTNTNEPAQQLTINVDITLEDGVTVKTTIPITVPKNPTSLVQNVQAKARAL